MKKMLLFVMSFVLASFVAASNEAIKPEGEGTAESPYLLTKIENLVWMGENIAECQSSVFRLENDIDAVETRNWINKVGNVQNGNFGFISIGDKILSKDGQEHKFSGIIDGQDHAIKNLFASSFSNCGCGALFSGLVKANISNLKLLNVHFGMNEGSSPSIGSLAKSINESTITNFHVTGQLFGQNVGGISATAKNSYFSNCSFTGKIKSFNKVNFAGGLIGDCTDCNFIRCRTSGSAFSPASASSRLGGLFGRVNYGTTDVVYCYSDMRLNAKGGVVGGLVGDNNMENYENYYGLITTNDFGFKQCYSDCEIEIEPGVITRGIAGWFTNCVCFNCFYNSDKTSGKGFGTDVDSTKIKKRSTFSNWSFGNVWEINEGSTAPYFAAEAGRFLKPALIGDWFGAVKVQPEKDGYDYGETITVTADPYEDAEFLNYCGALEGKEAQQTLTVDDNKMVEAIFARRIASVESFGKIGIDYPRYEHYVQTTDLDFSGIDFTNRVDCFTGTYDGQNHSVLNWKTSGWKAYGLFKQAIGAFICNLNIVDLDADGLKGGILVSDMVSDSLISNCYVLARITGADDNNGVVCGSAHDSRITKCIFIGEFNGVGSTFGGLCPAAYNSLLDECGVEIYSENLFLNCFNSSYSSNSKMVNCFAKGKFKGQLAYAGMSASNCYVNAEGSIRLGISGVMNCYFNSNCVEKVEGVTGFVSEEEMKKQETYAGWDFDEIWDIDEGVGTPYFRYAVPEPIGLAALLALALLLGKKR